MFLIVNFNLFNVEYILNDVTTNAILFSDLILPKKDLLGAFKKMRFLGWKL